MTMGRNPLDDRAAGTRSFLLSCSRARPQMVVTDSTPEESSASLFSWSLVRLTTSITTSLHGVGIIGHHPRLSAGEPGITSRMVDIAADRSWLQSVSRRYALSDEVTRQETALCEQIVWTVHQTCGGVADLMEWLAPDETVYLAWQRADLMRIVHAENAQRIARMEGYHRSPRYIDRGNATDDL